MDIFDSDLFGLFELFDMAGPSDAASAPSGRSVTTRIPGGYAKRKAGAYVVAHGHIDPDVAESVFRAAIAAWNISGSTEEDRDELLWATAEAFIHGTSSEINWEQVSFKFKGSVFTMAPFASVAAQAISYANPIRVWVRDFRKAEVAMRMHELLNNPDNLELRQMAAGTYGTTVDNARFCFDCAHALPTSGLYLGHSDIIMISKLASVAINRSQEDAISRGFAQANSNHAGTVGGAKPTPQSAPVVSTPAERGQFKPLR